MVAAYFELTPGLLDELQTAIEDGQAEVVAKAAHTLKGGCGNFFAKAAFQSALKLEQMGKSGELVGAEQSLECLRGDLEQLKSQLQDCLAK